MQRGMAVPSAILQDLLHDVDCDCDCDCEEGRGEGSGPKEEGVSGMAAVGVKYYSRAYTLEIVRICVSNILRRVCKQKKGDVLANWMIENCH